MLATRVFALPTALCLSLISPIAGQDDLDGRVSALISQADAAPLTNIWEYGLQIGDLATRDGQEDALARAIQKASAKTGNRGRLAGAVALQDLADGTVFGKEILDLLRPVTESNAADEQAAALAILAHGDLFNRRVQPDVLELLEKKVKTDLLEAEVRIAAAKGLWGMGDDEQRLAAKNALLEFLRSSNPKLRIQSALALAEINVDSSGPGWDILRDIAGQPTPEGRLALSYIKREEERRLFYSRLRNIMRNAQGGGGDATDDDDLKMLRELLYAATSQHIRGAQMKEEELVENAAKGLMRSLDQHSSFFTSDEIQRFFFDLNREYAGIGAFVNFDADGVFAITRPIYSGPAYRAGLRSGDKILQVDGWDTMGQTSEEIISRLKGEPNSTVVVNFIRPGLLEPQDVAIMREQIRVPSVNHDLLPGKVGFIELINFAQNTAFEVRKAIEDLEKRGATAMIIDVRNNTGGYLLAARDVVELFVPGRKLVVYTQGREEGDRLKYFTRNQASSPDLPLAVLVNNYSASASEITAGALQDHGRAKIVGQRSFGKGSVQQLLPLQSVPPEEFTDTNNNGEHDDWESYEDRNGNGKYDVGPHMKLTVARYHLPSGRSLHKDMDGNGKVLNPDWGIVPDSEIELREVSVKDAWRNAEIFELFRTGKFQEYVRDHIDDNQELFLDLADGDGGKTERYPEFETYYESLDTNLPKDDVRRWIRYLIRDEVADMRGKAYPGGRAVGDYQEDAQLQEAVRMLLAEQGEDIREVPEYRGVLKLERAGESKAAKK